MDTTATTTPPAPNNKGILDMEMGLVSVTTRQKHLKLRLPDMPMLYPPEEVVQSLLPKLLHVETVESSLIAALKPPFQQPPAWDPNTFRLYMRATSAAVQSELEQAEHTENTTYVNALKTVSELLLQEEENNELLKTLRMVLIQEK